MGLQLRMWMLIGVLFSIIYAVAVMAGTAMGVGSFRFYLILSFVLMFIQYQMGPKIIEWSMRVRYVERSEYPQLVAMVEQQAQRAAIPVPRVCVSGLTIPNAFAFGRGIRDGRVCVTKGIMQLLNDEELRAVIGHELSHIKNRDVLTMTLLSVIPLLLYRVAWHLFLFGGRRNDRGNTAMVGLVAFVFYFVTNLLVLYGSRIREYFADKGSVELGNRPEALASALYKLVYGSARARKEDRRQAEGFKAFFANDPSQADKEIRELAQLDLDRSGTIDPDELAHLRGQNIRLSFSDRMLEAMSSHPNMLKRIQHLAHLT